MSCRNRSAVLPKCAMTAGSDADSYSAHSGRERTMSPAEGPLQGPGTLRGAAITYCLNASLHAMWSGDKFAACSRIAPLICHRQASCSSRAQIREPPNPMSARAVPAASDKSVTPANPGWRERLLTGVSACRESCEKMHVYPSAISLEFYLLSHTSNAVGGG